VDTARALDGLPLSQADVDTIEVPTKMGVGLDKRSLSARVGMRPEHKSFRASVNRFLEEQFQTEAVTSAQVTAAMRAAAEQGFVGICVPEEYAGGGAGDDPRFDVLLCHEAYAAGHSAFALRMGLHNRVAAGLLARHASGPQRDMWLHEVAGAQRLTAVVDHGVVATPTTDGFVLTGLADAVVGAEDASMVIVTCDVERERRVLLVEGAATTRVAVNDELGLPGAGTADMIFNEVKVDAASALPDSQAAIEFLVGEHQLVMAVLAVTGARAALEMAVAYVQQRRVFGRRVADFGNTRRVLTDLAVEIASAEALVVEAVQAAGAGPVSPETTVVAAMAASRAHLRSVDQALQLHGGYGYMSEYPISRAFADAKLLDLHAGRARENRERLAVGLGLGGST
jgi:acyl-CoA dehydrogenase